MKRLFLFSLWILSVILVSSCSEEESGGFSIDITEDVVLTSEEGARAIVSFTSNLGWMASVSADWLEISPDEGQAGSNTILITALTENDSDNARTATLTLMSGGVRQK